MTRILLGLFLCSSLAVVHGQAWAARPACGDGKCNGGEDVVSCPADCGGGPVCGDGTCDTGEDCAACEADCGICPPPSCDDNGICNAGEDCQGCGDCAGRSNGPPSGRYCCGADTCDAGLCGAGCGLPSCGDGLCDGASEDCGSCQIDCGSCGGCGDGICDANEDCSTCSDDCGACPFCGDGTCNGNEDPSTCYSDCGSCGDGLCTAGSEDCATCSLDCGSCSSCGDGTCDGATEDCATCDVDCGACPLTPDASFTAGDSITEGEAAENDLGSANHHLVWSTGWDTRVTSIDQRFSALEPGYSANGSGTDGARNRAVSGSVMDDFVTQAAQIANEVTATEDSALLLFFGNNDICDSNYTYDAGLSDCWDEATNSCEPGCTGGSGNCLGMTPLPSYEAQFRAGLDVLAADAEVWNADIVIVGVPNIYWLWESMRDQGCGFIWLFVPCSNLLAGSNDCASAASVQDPGIVYPGDGDNCRRKKEFSRLIRDVYNPALEQILAGEYVTTGVLPNAQFVDIYDIRFTSQDVNTADCFHPSVAGQDLLAREVWCRTAWGLADPVCQ